MKARGNYKPNALEYEIINGGKTAIIRLYENITPFEEPEEDGRPGASGWEFDRYTLQRPHSEELQKKVEADIPLWLKYARQEESDALSTDLRATRNKLLEETDRTQIPDTPITDKSRADLRAYRQKLRDVPEQPGFPYNVEWPECPPIEKADPAPVDLADTSEQ